MLIIYNLFLVPLLWLGFKIGSLFNEKIRQGNLARKGQPARIKNAISNLKPETKRILVHCTSVGEWEQAVPIIDRIKKINPSIFIVVSFFSPSGFNYVKSHLSVDLKIYLPLDTKPAARKLMETIRPEMWIISKFDVWPNHLAVARKMKIPIVLTAATLSPNSGRIKGLAKMLNKSVYKYFDYIFPISDDDLERFMVLFPYREKMTVAGDTRFDRVFAKSEKTRKAGNISVFEPDKNALTIIGGSTWQPDEKHFLPALISLLKRHNNLRAIVVPHELHKSHLVEIEAAFSAEEIETERYTEFSDAGFTTKKVAIVDTIGMLARLYLQTDLAYVGGSFSSGVHNVMEPAVFGQPVVFGPVHVNSFEALELKKIGSAFAVENTQDIEDIFGRLIIDTKYRKEINANAVNLIKNNLGATDKIINLLTERYDFIS